MQIGLGNTRGCAWESGAEDRMISIDIFFTEVFCTQLFVHNVCQANICGITLINSPLYRRLYLNFALLFILCPLKFL